MQKHLKVVLRILLGCIGLAWLVVPVSTWKGFVIFASFTMLIAALVIAYGFMENERAKEIQE